MDWWCLHSLLRSILRVRRHPIVGLTAAEFDVATDQRTGAAWTLPCSVPMLVLLIAAFVHLQVAASAEQPWPARVAEPTFVARNTSALPAGGGSYTRILYLRDRSVQPVRVADYRQVEPEGPLQFVGERSPKVRSSVNLRRHPMLDVSALVLAAALVVGLLLFKRPRRTGSYACGSGP